MLSDLLIVLGIILAFLLGFVFMMISVIYAMGEWHKDKNKRRNLNDNQG